MKKLLFALLFFPTLAQAYSTTFNPFTGKPDYVGFNTVSSGTATEFYTSSITIPSGYLSDSLSLFPVVHSLGVTYSQFYNHARLNSSFGYLTGGNYWITASSGTTFDTGSNGGGIFLNTSGLQFGYGNSVTGFPSYSVGVVNGIGATVTGGIVIDSATFTSVAASSFTNTSQLLLSGGANLTLQDIKSATALATDSSGNVIAGSSAGSQRFPQVFVSSISASYTTTNTTWTVVTNSSFTVTSSSASSVWTYSWSTAVYGNAGQALNITVFRDGTNLCDQTYGCLRINTNVWDMDGSGFAWSAPADTASHTYTLKFRSESGANTAYFASEGSAYMKLEESIRP